MSFGSPVHLPILFLNPLLLLRVVVESVLVVLEALNAKLSLRFLIRVELFLDSFLKS